MQHRQDEPWVVAVRRATRTPVDAEAYLDRRLQFRTAVAAALTHGLLGDAREAVYGVWIDDGGDPIYIGQTADARRRLWDLPIGESHHLANSFPTELWERVVVVFWGYFLESDQKLLTSVERSLAGLDPRVPWRRAAGLGLEHLLQDATVPLFNRRVKRRDGGWRTVSWATSSSVGARAAPLVRPLFEVVAPTWERLAYASVGATASLEVAGGRAVFPQLI